MTRLIRRILFTAIILAAVLTTAGVVGWRYYFPYGWSHSCIKQFPLLLTEYAKKHDGWYPRGESCTEASLSLLVRGQPEQAELIRGKTVPADVVEARLAQGLLLDAATCGWHYVEGLREDDDKEVAILWDKVGLGHNGQRLSAGGHEVLFLSGAVLIVSEADWPAFLERQQRLLAARDRR